MKPMKRAAVIHDLCSVGRVALNNILPVLSVMGVEVCPIPTMLLSTHTGGYGKPEVVSLNQYPSRCNRHFKENNIEFDGILVGYQGNTEMVAETEAFLRDHAHAVVIVDPIFGDHGTLYSNFNMDYVASMKALIRRSHIITPNYTEACLLCGAKYSNRGGREEMEMLCRQLSDQGAHDVVITSIPSENENQIGYAVYEDSKLSLFHEQKNSRDYPGTGDLFTSVLTGSILSGKSLIESANAAHVFVRTCIEFSSQYEYPAREGVMFEPNLKYLIET